MDLLILIGTILLLFIVWAEILYYFAGKNNKIVFFGLFSIGIISLIMSKLTNLLTSTNILTLIISVVSVFFIIFWGTTLYEQAGNKQKKWYYLTLIIPLLAIVYQIVENK